MRTETIALGVEEEATYDLQVQGEMGFRQFFLVAQEGNRCLRLGLPKELILLLVTRLQEILRRLGVTTSNLDLVPPQFNGAELEAAQQLLIQYVGLSLDQDRRLLLTVYGLPEITDIPGKMVYPHVVLTIGLAAAQALVNRIWLVVLQGRPTCIICGKPLNSGHICKED
ncbi:MAG: DUF3090 family protein [Chloroflexi bacterium]|nr:DUF3090 family protein [Chloroflexota bacterium]